MDTESFVFPFTPYKGLVNILKHFTKDSDLSEIYPAHELYSEDNKKGNRKNET